MGIGSTIIINILLLSVRESSLYDPRAERVNPLLANYDNSRS